MTYGVEEVGLDSLSSEGGLLQSPTWARFKGEHGWSASVVRLAGGPWAGIGILVLTRAVAPGFTLAYVPHAPPMADFQSTASPPADHLHELGDSIVRILPGEPFCVRFDLLWPVGTLQNTSRRSGVRKSPVDVQPPSTVRIDLSPSPEDLLAAMHKKWRYNIRLAEKRGVEVQRFTTAAAISRFDEWYDIYLETARRDRIAIHGRAYYRRLFEIAEGSDDARIHLYLATHEGELLAGVIVSEQGEEAVYLYGASSSRKRDLMPNYALQWEAIRGAKTRGASFYDFFGIPPADDPSHPMHGLYRFKTGFGGDIVHRDGSWDVVCAPLLYAVYRSAERVRSFYYHRLRKALAR